MFPGVAQWPLRGAFCLSEAHSGAHSGSLDLAGGRKIGPYRSGRGWSCKDPPPKIRAKKGESMGILSEIPMFWFLLLIVIYFYRYYGSTADRPMFGTRMLNWSKKQTLWLDRSPTSTPSRSLCWEFLRGFLMCSFLNHHGYLFDKS